MKFNCYQLKVVNGGRCSQGVRMYVNMNNYDATCIGSRMRRAAIDRL